jgi:hypothetical protein
MDALCIIFCPAIPSLGPKVSQGHSYSNSNSKCICAQVLNCANGCTVYYFLPSLAIPSPWGTRSPKDCSHSYRNSKCICAQVLNCANGCAVYYFLPCHTKSGGQGLPRTMAIVCICIRCANAFAHFSSWAQMHLRTLVDLRRRLRSTTFVLHLLLLDDQERIYLTFPERKCICAQVLKCANGCAIYQAIPSLSDKVSQEL